MVDVESQVFSRIFYEFSDTLKTKYNLDIDNFTTKGTSNTDTVFPLIYVHLLPAMEQGQTLENTDIESGLYTIQIDVSDNSDPDIAKRLMDECVRIMKGMRFSIPTMPEFYFNQTSVYRQTARFRRLIGSEDIF